MEGQGWEILEHMSRGGIDISGPVFGGEGDSRDLV